MSQSFKFIYDDLKDNDPTKKETSSGHSTKAYDEFYTGESHARNVCFVWLDGRRMFMNYSYLVSGEYLPQAGTITLTFTSHTFNLVGVNLEALFYNYMHHLIRQVVCVDARYNIIGEDQKPIVNSISLSRA